MSRTSPGTRGFDPHREHLDRLKQRLGERTELALVLGVEVRQQLSEHVASVDWTVSETHRNRLEQLLGVAHQRDPSHLELAHGHPSSRARFRLVDCGLQLLRIERASRATLDLVVLDEVAGCDPVRR